MTTLLRTQLLITLLFIGLPSFLFCQKLDHVIGDVLVQFQSNDDVDEFVNEFQIFQGKPTQLKIKKELIPSMQIWSFHFDANTIHEFLFLEKIKTHRLVVNAQFDHFIKLRSTIPDDPQFGQQWQFLNDGTNGLIDDADIDAELAWDITTGGLSPNGDTIVVCVIDAGIDHDHPDLEENIWLNYSEIPNNGIDDDNNGFTDDRRGWNSFTNTDNTFTNDDHGTPVNGLIGAIGNNNLGVTGVNWNVKIMNVVGGSGVESEVLVSYSYPLIHRKKYNDTNGAEGAFVVATNASWGVDNGQASEVPLWCAMYDSLGAQGILNCGAAANEDVDVEIVGDLPTTCPSDFLIGVTSTNSADEKSTSSAYGNVSIDLGATGGNVFTIDFSGGYNTFNGTSAACPIVAGSIALLYSAPCSNLASLAMNDPAAAALEVREYILNGTDPITALDGITVTGGRLNVFNSINLVIDNCGPCPTPSSLITNNITTSSVEMTWINSNPTTSVNLRYRVLGAANWTDVSNVNSPFLISNLSECTNYEVQVEALCTNLLSGFTNSTIFTSDGCCLPPNDISISSMTDSTATITWTPITAALEYNITLTSLGQPMTFTTSDANFSFNNLDPCTEYEISIQTVCSSGTTNFSDLFLFTTPNCGTCLDANYCNAGSDDASDEWIESVSFHTLNNISGNNLGYGDFTTLGDLEVNAGQTYTLSIEPEYTSSNFLEYFRAWIDYNQDGDFEDVDELVLDTPDPMNVTVSQDVTIPMTAVSGSTRMRVMMRWGGSSMSQQPPCSVLDFGEFEDYCINIIGGTGIPCLPPPNLDTMQTSLTSALLTWSEPSNFESYILEYRKENNASWISIPTAFPSLNLLGLEKCNTYEARVSTVCDGLNESNFSEIFVFETQCDVGVDPIEEISELNIFPNPFQDNITLTFSIFEKKEITFELYSSSGRLFFHKKNEFNSGEHVIPFENFNHLPAGIYFFQIKTDKESIVKKLIK